MWEVRLSDARRTRGFRPVQSADVSVDEIVRLAEQLLSLDDEDRGPAVDALRRLVGRSTRVAGGPTQRAERASVPILEPIGSWAEEAVAAASGVADGVELREADGGLGLVENERLSSFSWHGDSVAVVPILEATRSVELVYRPSASERSHRDRIYDTYWKQLDVPRWWPWPHVEMSADVVGFFAIGEDGWTSADITPRTSRHSYRFQVQLASRAAGFLVVKPLYRLARDLRVSARDPLWPARLRRAEQAFTGNSPLLRDAEPANGRLLVLVHGLASTAAEMAEMLAPLRLQATRFEHDTFISIDANATELSELLTARGEGTDSVTLLCHSRGGLVARAAADMLPDTLAARTSIHTFGTPHLGTPLADFAPIVGLIHLADFLRHPWDVVRAADRYLLPRSWRTPEGIAEMGPDHHFIARMMRGVHRDIETLNAWGAEYQNGCPGAWWYAPFATACADILAAPHDLIVPESSARGAGNPQGPLHAASTHFDYLGLAQIHDHIRSLL
jgi:hypothetical protein